MLFHPANIAYWIFLAIGVLLFLLVILSGGGDENLELEGDVDADIDTDGNFLPLEILGWLGIGKAPLILLLAIDFSTWGVVGWLLNVVMGNLTGTIPQRFMGLGGVVFLSSLGLSLFLGSTISRPLGKIFADFGEDTSSDRLLGCVGVVTSKEVPYLIEGKIGQADVLDNSRNLVTITICLPQWAKVVPQRGEQVLIIDRTQNGYLVIAKDSTDEELWLDNS
ncbi:MAG: DUF1449 family protein [Prochloron sp. SP5CPC1]|nr:DUF1449 family protein [Candidatus Paraprochloron terpiosi SP5CPC1]